MYDVTFIPVKIAGLSLIKTYYPLKFCVWNKLVMKLMDHLVLIKSFVKKKGLEKVS